MNQSLKLLRAGFATFSMFFGAGNILFPLAVGFETQAECYWAVWGLLLTAVLIPFLGLTVMARYQGDYRTFFGRLGRIPGFCIASLIILLLGPLGSTPRCIALAYATMKVSIPHLSAYGFSVGSCALILFCTLKRRALLDVLGYFLTPVLLATLTFVIVLGVIGAPDAAPSSYSPSSAFWLGLTEGYFTMDLLAAFFFASVIIRGIRRDLGDKASDQQVVIQTFKASAIGASLLGFVYVCFGWMAAHHGGSIAGLTTERLLGALMRHILGEGAGVAAALTISLACLTTAIALTSVFAEYLSFAVFGGRLSYSAALLLTTAVTCVVSMAELMSILAFLGPVLEWLYPLLILLTLYNLFTPAKNRESTLETCASKAVEC